MKYFIHLFHASGRSELYGPFDTKKRAKERALAIYSNYDFRSWSVCVSENDGTTDPEDCMRIVWQREAETD
jgi:hypothetical protein